MSVETAPQLLVAFPAGSLRAAVQQQQLLELVRFVTSFWQMQFAHHIRTKPINCCAGRARCTRSFGPSAIMDQPYLSTWGDAAMVAGFALLFFVADFVTLFCVSGMSGWRVSRVAN